MRNYWKLLPRSGRVFSIFGSLDIRPDMGHRETLVLLAGAGRAFAEILLALVEREFLAAIDTHVFSRPDFLACCIRLLFGQMYHQTSLLYRRYISVVLVHPHTTSSYTCQKSLTYAKLYWFFSPNAGMIQKVIGLLGSPLPEGNTARLLARAVQGTKDAGLHRGTRPGDQPGFPGLPGKFFCRDHETCILDDDMQQIYPKFVDMDGLILATPVMTMGIPGTLKAFMDRFQVFFMAKYFRNQSLVSPDQKEKRAGLFICISGMDIPEVFVGAKLTTRAFFDIIDCQYPG